jgi:hypothetical protein
MTDDLRGRTAKLLYRLYGPSHPRYGWDDEPYMTQDDYRRDADAVIRELGLSEDLAIE